MFGRRKQPPPIVATADVEVLNPHGLGPHVALAIAALSRRFRAKITIGAHGREAVPDVDALLMLGASQGEVLVVRCEGDDSSAALAAVIDALGGRPA